MRFLVFVALVLLFVFVVVPWLRGLGTPRPNPSARRNELVKDPVCQTYVVLSRAIRTDVGGQPVHFCSRECAERYRRGEWRA